MFNDLNMRTHRLRPLRHFKAFPFDLKELANMERSPFLFRRRTIWKPLPAASATGLSVELLHLFLSTVIFSQRLFPLKGYFSRKDI